MSGFNAGSDGDFDRVFFTDEELFTQFVGSSAYGWGLNNQGQLGDNTVTARSSPVITSGGGTNWKQVDANYFDPGTHTSAGIKTDGTLWTWGNNSRGTLGDGTVTSRRSPVTTSGGGTDWKQVSIAENTAAIKTDGTLWTWGYNLYGGLGDGTATNRSSPGTTAGGGTNWKQVVCGKNDAAAIKTDGTLWTWGYNGFGQLGTGTITNRSSPGTTAGGGTNWTQVACGYTHTAAIKTDGTLWTWGYNQYGRLGDGTTTNRSSPGTTAGGGTNWKQVACGYTHTAAIKTDGTLWTWGFNGSGGLGDGTTTNRSSPGTTAGGGTNWKQVACGYQKTAAIKTDGTLWTWGYNAYGGLGDGTITTRSSPGTTYSNWNTWRQVACAYHTLAVQYN